jgi:hypothetical protein
VLLPLPCFWPPPLADASPPHPSFLPCSQVQEHLHALGKLFESMPLTLSHRSATVPLARRHRCPHSVSPCVEPSHSCSCRGMVLRVPRLCKSPRGSYRPSPSMTVITSPHRCQRATSLRHPLYLMRAGAPHLGTAVKTSPLTCHRLRRELRRSSIRAALAAPLHRAMWADPAASGSCAAVPGQAELTEHTSTSWAACRFHPIGRSELKSLTISLRFKFIFKL